MTEKQDKSYQAQMKETAKFRFTDIRYDTMLAALPRWAQPYIRIARLDRPVGIWLLFLPCIFALIMASFAVGMPFRWDLLLLFGLGSLVMRAAGCIVNDLWDRKLDEQVERTAMRPLPAGELTLLKTFVFLAVLLVAGLLILLQMPLPTILIGFAAMILVVVYPLMKRITYWPQLFLGLTFNIGTVMAWLAAGGSFLSPVPYLLYVGCIFWTLAYDTIYAFQDIEDDMHIGVKSTAQLCHNRPKLFVGTAYIISIALFSVALFILGGWWWSILLPIAHILWLVWRWNPESQISSLLSFQQARNTGFLIIAAILLASMGLYF